MFWNRLSRDVMSSTKIFQCRLYKFMPLHNRRLYWMSSYPFQAYSRNAIKNYRVYLCDKSLFKLWNCISAWCYQLLILIWATALCAGIPSCYEVLISLVVLKVFQTARSVAMISTTKLRRAACMTPHFSLRCGNTPLYPSIGSGHGLAGSGTNLGKLGLPVNGTIVLLVSLLPDSSLKAGIYFPTSWAVSEVNRDELKDLMLAAWKANNSVPGTVTRQLVNINFSKSVTLTALSKNLFFRPKEILGNLHSKTHLGTFQTINLHLSGF